MTKRKIRKSRALFVMIIFFVILTVLLTGIYKIYTQTVYPLRYEKYIDQYSSEYNVDKYLIMAIIRAESNYIHNAKSSSNANGLMQITNETYKWICDKIDLDSKNDDIFDPQNNIKAGCFYISHLIDKYDGDLVLALAAYNAGMGNVDKWLNDENYCTDGKSLNYIPFKETRNYVEKVQRYKEIYFKLYSNE